MFSPQQFAINLIANNPRFQNNPQAQEMLKVIQTNDKTRGEQIAQNLCNSMGMSREQAVGQARQFFGM